MTDRASFFAACLVAALSCGCSEQAMPAVGPPGQINRPPPPPAGDAFAHKTFAAPLSLADAEQILLKTTWFEIGGMPPKRQVQAFNRVFDQPNARELFESIAARAETAGRLYALCGLIATQSSKAAGVEQDVAARREPIPVWDFDVIHQKTPADVIALIRTRRLWDEFRRDRVEARVHFDKDAPMTVADRHATIEAYQQAIGRARTSGNFLEQAFLALMTMEDALMQTENGERVIEALSETDFRKLQKELPGAVIFREEIVGVRPDVPYFRRLANAHGDAADRAFFATLSATRDESGWPSYMQQQTDYSGCTRFGSGKLVGAYRDWTTFVEKYPGRYGRWASDEVSEAGGQLTESTCACGDAASVRTELEQFVRDFVTAPIRSRVEQRLDALKAGQSTIRMHCRSG